MFLFNPQRKSGSVSYLDNGRYALNRKQEMQFSVVQSDGKSFCGDVVLDSFYMAFKTKNMKSKSFVFYYNEDLREIEAYAYSKKYST